jgi:pimeloyl-ACP methyl ester carboxylesterase
VTVPTLPGIEARTIATGRLTTRVLVAGDPDGTPVLFLHGNISSATWWETTMLALPEGFRGIAPDQRGYGDADRSVTIDATRGMGDLSDDAVALLDELDIHSAIVVGSSLGGSVAWRMIADHPGRISSVVQVAPGSPYGFGATHGLDGARTTEDFAGSGGGLINPRLVELMQSEDMGTDDVFSPRNVFRMSIVRHGFISEREDAYLASMMSTHFGPDGYPGDAVASSNWPFVGPGVLGGSNATSPKWITAHRTALEAEPKPHVTWIRGGLDLVVADGGSADPGVWGPTGLVPGFPGSDAYPPQPMVSQTRAWLDRYADRGGSYDEVVLPEAAHAPYIDDAEAFNGVFHAHLRNSKRMSKTRSDR